MQHDASLPSGSAGCGPRGAHAPPGRRRPGRRALPPPFPPQPQLPVVATFEIQNVNWLARLGGQEVHVTGGGTYTRAESSPALERIQLELRIGDDPPRHFFGSGAAAEPLPVIALEVSDGQPCIGTFFRFRAAPVPRAEVKPYRLDDATFFEGCLPPCQCVLAQTARLVGRLRLVDVSPQRDGSAHAVVGARFRVRPVLGAPALSLPRRIRGFGFYERGLPPPRAVQRMRLALRLDRGEPTTFESGLRPGGDAFPDRIEIPLARGDFQCFDQVIDLRARAR